RTLGVGEALFGWYDSSWARNTLSLGFHRPGQVTSQMISSLKWRMDRPGARAAALATLRAMHFAEQERGYRSLKHPALVLWGQHDAIAAPTFGRQLAADLRGELRVFPQCGHFPMIEAADESTAALRNFLSAL
ncbi:MAG TPA: alpha/beta fold hydrolase, partial [Myxococcaceae bacterium]|nr:alpha/beta fold hydrolase [Myxococcaceae bacterium]